jgi:hypothetical protein
MKRLVTAAALVAAMWFVAAGHVDATTSKTHHQSTCSKINAALQSGASMKSVEKEFKVSRSRINQCQQQKTASTAHSRRSSSQAH